MRKQAILELLSLDEIKALSCDLIALESENPAPPGKPNTSNETAVADYIYQFFIRHGISAEKQLVTGERFNVIATLKGTDPNAPVLAFNGHTDVVPAGDLSLWRSEPYQPEVRNGKLYGRGACDMKASIACFMHVMAVIKANNIPHRGDIVFTAVIDEEKSNMGINALLESGFAPDYCIVGEATELAITIGHRGVLAFDITVEGESCHAAMTAQGQGINAILHGCRVVSEIEALNRELQQKTSPVLGFSQLNVTGFQSGIKVNVIPDKAVLQVDGRTALGETLLDIQRKLVARLNDLVKRGEIKNYQLVPTTFCPSYELDLQDSFLLLAQNAAQQIGLSTKTAIFGATCEASLIAAKGASVIIFGAGSLSQAHNANEFVDVDHLLATSAFYLSCIYELEQEEPLCNGRT